MPTISTSWVEHWVTAAFEKVEKESTKVGLAVNGDKTKLMVSTTKTSSRIGPQVKVENCNFVVFNDFIYLGTALNKPNNISFEIKRRTILANRC